MWTECPGNVSSTREVQKVRELSHRTAGLHQTPLAQQGHHREAVTHCCSGSRPCLTPVVSLTLVASHGKPAGWSYIRIAKARDESKTQQNLLSQGQPLRMVEDEPMSLSQGNPTPECMGLN